MTDQTLKSWIVLYKDNARLASVENSPANLAYLKSRFSMSLIQEDITGTLHYSVILPVKPSRKKIKAF